jgi:hypothetical protein
MATNRFQGGEQLISEFLSIAESNRHAGLTSPKGVPDRFPVARCRVEIFGNSLYQPVEGGLPALVVIVWAIPPFIPVRSADGFQAVPGIEARPGSAIDLCAIDRRNDRVFSRRGVAIALGEQSMDCASRDGALRFTFSPSAWIENGGTGVCPIDNKAFTRWCLARPWLRLIAHNERDCNRLALLLNQHRTPLPRIGVQAFDRGLAA